ncbi:GTP pyrophosphokinase [Massilia violaceinigra]|uniref:GTP pyrophosphokinase n=1 Tax=Massilia violaceinigra TaxID=2045208 RepID=UPI0026C81EFC|nr:(p)ppGpp synthetase [Massilia violaceinigra]
MIGLRVVCLYEDDIDKIKKCLEEHFDVIDITDKIAIIENTEGSFGYKGLHLDLKLNGQRKPLPEYFVYSEFRFEVQIRTIIQDSWSVLDHKIQYKKEIPNKLRRRINTLAALFELADREFREIRNSTYDEIEKAEKEEIEEVDAVPTLQRIVGEADQDRVNSQNGKLNVFSFLKIAKHFFDGFEFESHKVDGFTQEIVSLMHDVTRKKFNFYMKENIAKVKKYQVHFEIENISDKLNPYTIIRHCLYLGDKSVFSKLLTNLAKNNFEAWLKENG